MDEIKLYEYENSKPELEYYIQHYNHNHDPRNGQFTTGSSVGGLSTRKRKKMEDKKAKQKKKESKTTKTKEQALEDRDLQYIKEHVDDFSTKELNDLLNRINTESRLNDMAAKESSKNKSKIKKIISSPAFKLTAALALSGLSYASYNAYKGATAPTPRLTDKSNPYRNQFIKDIGTGIGKGVERKIKKKAGIGK
jgi:hypothetical protein